MIMIEYGKPVAEVYSYAAITIMILTSDLSVLTYAYHSPDCDGYPGYKSWIPQWDLCWPISYIRPPLFVKHR
jgi:hypothetical protein